LNNQEPGVIKGEFFTDGKTFALRIHGLPISGVGASPQAAFDDLLRAEAAAGDLPERLRAIARDQAGEHVRATLIRVVATTLIVLTLLGGLVAGIATVAPKIATDLGDVSLRMMNAGQQSNTQNGANSGSQPAQAEPRPAP